MRLAPAFLLLALAASPLAAQSGSGAGAFFVPERGRAYGSLQDAVSAIGNGSGTIEIAPGSYRQCAVQERGEVAYVARQPGTVAFDGAACEDKAALVLRGRGARVEGLIFENIRVPDANGAGIRLEQGNLTVRESLFRDGESGILAGDDRGGAILVEQSTFSGLGRCDRDLDCAHSIYIGNYGSLTVRRSRFERGRGGHYVKSRAARIEVADCSFDDSAGHLTNYMIDLPNGATGLIAGNLFVQGRDKENESAFITVAAEGVANSSAGLTIRDNEAELVPGLRRDTAFVADFTGEAMRIEGNRLAPGIARYQRR
ncbi:MAG TPA: right-handed parallel beta-helix repeat-containing protein [Allosphingosinicella sp.]|nr:right-handed parallel beta-helix repeat-containing protein [Allosphingosinicella sp.]